MVASSDKLRRMAATLSAFIGGSFSYNAQPQIHAGERRYQLVNLYLCPSVVSFSSIDIQKGK
jgi:hypothetical protein